MERSRTGEAGFGRNRTGNRTGEVALGAALGFAAGALLANPARKLAMQGAEALMSRDWVEALTHEHQLVRKMFDTLQETAERDAGKRKSLLMHIDQALTKHALEEEKVIYPALRRVDEQQARHLFEDHAELKSIISDLMFNLDAKNPSWIVRVRELREIIERHMREEEDEIFPMFRERLSEEDNANLTRNMHLQGAIVS
jgi:hemerythrin superfamily protein